MALQACVRVYRLFSAFVLPTVLEQVLRQTEQYNRMSKGSIGLQINYELDQTRKTNPIQL
jgi:hypothetical protein